LSSSFRLDFFDSYTVPFKHQFPLDYVIFGFEALGIFYNLFAVLHIGEVGNIAAFLFQCSDSIFQPLPGFGRIAGKFFVLSRNQNKLDLPLQVGDLACPLEQAQFLPPSGFFLAVKGYVS
jgi:hypothetical protein